MTDGASLGTLNKAEFVIDTESGKVQSIVLPRSHGPLRRKDELVIPWNAIRKVGPEVIIIETSPGE